MQSNFEKLKGDKKTGLLQNKYYKRLSSGRLVVPSPSLAYNGIH